MPASHDRLEHLRSLWELPLRLKPFPWYLAVRTSANVRFKLRHGSGVTREGRGLWRGSFLKQCCPGNRWQVTFFTASLHCCLSSKSLHSLLWFWFDLATSVKMVTIWCSLLWFWFETVQLATVTSNQKWIMVELNQSLILVLNSSVQLATLTITPIASYLKSKQPILQDALILNQLCDISDHSYRYKFSHSL